MNVKQCIDLLERSEKFKVVINKKFSIGGMSKAQYLTYPNLIKYQIDECLSYRVKKVITETIDGTSCKVFYIEPKTALVNKILDLENNWYNENNIFIKGGQNIWVD